MKKDFGDEYDMENQQPQVSYKSKPLKNNKIQSIACLKPKDKIAVYRISRKDKRYPRLKYHIQPEHAATRLKGMLIF